MSTIKDASNAYANVLNQVSKQASTGGEASGGAFGEFLTQSLNSAVEAQHKSEAVSGAALAGKADMTEVLQAVNDAEIALKEVLAIRDKLLQAYEQTMRTPM